MWYCLVPKMLQDKAHLRVVSKIPVLLVKAKVGGVEVEDEGGRLAVKLLEYVLGGGHARGGDFGHVDFICFHRRCSGTDAREAGAGISSLAEGL